MIKAIFFDFNGVIIDDETIQMKAYQEMLRGHDINLLEDGALKLALKRNGDGRSRAADV